MAKYSKFSQSSPSWSERLKVHPVWQGIGCILLILIPVMSYAGAVLLVEANLDQGWIPYAAELHRDVSLPVLNLTVAHLYANLIVTALLSLFGFALLTFFYSLISQASGASRLGPLDAPPVRTRPKPKPKYRR